MFVFQPISTTYQGLNGALVGLLAEAAWPVGTFGNQLQSALFQTATSGYSVATDLLAANINRGRDHGLQPYLYYLGMCNSSFANITTWAQLSATNLIASNAITAMQNLYA